MPRRKSTPQQQAISKRRHVESRKLKRKNMTPEEKDLVNQQRRQLYREQLSKMSEEEKLKLRQRKHKYYLKIKALPMPEIVTGDDDEILAGSKEQEVNKKGHCSINQSPEPMPMSSSDMLKSPQQEIPVEVNSKSNGSNMSPSSRNNNNSYMSNEFSYENLPSPKTEIGEVKVERPSSISGSSKASLDDDDDDEDAQNESSASDSEEEDDECNAEDSVPIIVELECDICHSKVSDLSHHLRTVHLKVEEEKAETDSDDDESCSDEEKVTVRNEKYPVMVIKPSTSIQEWKSHCSLIPDSGRRECNLCAKTFRTLHHFLEHYRVTHINVRYKCDQCGKELHYHCSIKKHYERFHLPQLDPQSSKRNVRKFACNHDAKCGKKFHSAAGLQRHIKMVHLRLRDHQCEQCGKRFCQISALKSHHNLKICEKKKVLKVRKIELYRKQQEASKVPKKAKCQCKECGLGFTRLAHLKGHIKTVHEQPEKREFKCKKCGKLFKTATHLKGHFKEVHLKLKEFECDLCKRKYGRRETLTKHRKLVHSGMYDEKKRNEDGQFILPD